MRRQVIAFIAAAAFMLCAPQAASAYVGPGAGLTIIGAALAFVAAVVLGLFGFVWYPVKRVIRAISKTGESESESGA